MSGEESRKRKLSSTSPTGSSSKGDASGHISSGMQPPLKKKLSYMASKTNFNQKLKTDSSMSNNRGEEDLEQGDEEDDDVLQFQKRAIWRQMRDYKRRWANSQSNLTKLERKYDTSQALIDEMTECWNWLYDDLQSAVLPILSNEQSNPEILGNWMTYLASRAEKAPTYINKGAINTMVDFINYCHNSIKKTFRISVENIRHSIEKSSQSPDLKATFEMELRKYIDAWARSEQIGELHAKLLDEVQPLKHERDRLKRKVVDLNTKLETIESKLWKTKKTLDRHRLEPSSVTPLTPTATDTPHTSLEASSAMPSTMSIDSPKEDGQIGDLELLTKDLERSEQINLKRLDEIKKYQEDLVSLRQECESLKIGRLSDRAIMDSQIYRNQQNMYYNAKNELQDLRAHIDRLMQEITETHFNHDKALREVQANEEKEYSDFKAKKHHLEQYIDSLEREKFELKTALEQSKARVDSIRISGTEADKLLDAIRGQNTVLQEEARRLKKLSVLVERVKGATSNDEKVAELENLVSSLQEDEAALISEIETIGKAFEDLQEQNSRLLSQAREKEDVNVRLLQDKIKAEHDQQLLRQERENHKRKVSSMKQEETYRNDAVQKLRSQEHDLRLKLAKLEKDLSSMRASSETHRRKVSELSHILTDMRYKLDQSTSQCRSLDENLKSLVKESETLKYEKKRLQEENTTQRKKLAIYKKKFDGVSVDNDLEEELASYKTLLRCNTCELRPKDTVLLRCMHCFCRDCIDTRVETRQRKCPTCGEPFGLNDIRTIYL